MKGKPKKKNTFLKDSGKEIRRRFQWMKERKKLTNHQHH